MKVYRVNYNSLLKCQIQILSKSPSYYNRWISNRISGKCKAAIIIIIIITSWCKTNWSNSFFWIRRLSFPSNKRSNKDQCSFSNRISEEWPKKTRCHSNHTIRKGPAVGIWMKLKILQKRKRWRSKTSLLIKNIRHLKAV